ncbi:MAG: KDO2-lipid IV(A) lauroyltransferase [Flavobacteriaceae bacterium]|jgi:KDO2-lipid IV(A) lauroyltransferase|uniref:lysophospholipid acyltransferase family protein n=1 Tax=Candidatus Marifrigoribacter sp. Uisw_064 TaxID=3230970 RepID=UPI003AD97476
MQLLIYILVYPFLWITSILPMKWLYRVSTLLYYPLYYVFGYRKKVVFENLHIVFPEKTSEERKNIAKKFYRHLCDMLVESIKTLSISEEEIIKRFAFTNIEEIKNIEKENKSIILMCAHYASWEWIFIMQKYVNHKGYAIYKRLANAYFDRLVQRIRAKYDTHLVTTKETFEILTKSKEIGELTINGFLSDQSPKKDKAFHWSEFMGVKVPVHTGAELLAKRLDMAVVYFLVKKLKRGHYETTFTTITLNPNEYKDYEITDIFTKALEEQIREAPEFYLWTHKRWKHRDNIPEQFQ